ncbi:octanoyl-(acyl carrier protein)--protein octanoyltransferase [Syntrophotalea carbinolica DSM 2380]|uniref:Octanoyltransferase n=1 Tax=Syntrophotalea carbinolica (strain DSM 2380 / NBRC 103641 / GraBd1) TaxID=338963 RepID=LIPB_SYNC1|nr:lipoyl(octanoyl) transferase LipB [Syntrophotalea carbinolica]Q3A7N4.1 RecName: Full=Octanoyltransferase; AltName: Full=Lipoate-protein ligase B; AltName: Full=Lipoyl/octanoyl transferase; AltName: Full=Octanoyl-[acyl-carrier-protein]-protein N-octanoyltransferase [Syntrophotalea carbinolica DSM 2380]ABA87610.1 octanoyl-(acyl carrier protein)--protein octanoyltransferase [Syntrophotalea carbinolica DSM 2380]
MEIKDLGVMPYAEAYALQEQLVRDIAAGSAPETLLLVEHPPVYTLGRSGHMENLLDDSIEVVSINRGGDITYHAPGQLVGYPLLNLGLRGRDLRHYLRFLEEVLIAAAADTGVEGFRREGKTGVWTEQGKLASIGAGARRWVTMHGFALNVCLDLSGFSRIHPCGIVGCTMTSLQQITGQPVSMAQVKARVVYHFQSLLKTWLPLAQVATL